MQKNSGVVGKSAKHAPIAYKDTLMQLPKQYDPKKYEADIYALWEASGAFTPVGEGTPYSIVMPPPNANANLHIGTGMTIAIQDVLIRYHRMKGEKTLYLPGADHAGFETWVVYEKYLEKQGKSRFDFTREELYQQTWDFVAQNRGNMELQMRELGASADWSRFTFTLDDNIVDRAYKTFKQLWDDKLIYRGERIVNYCTTHGTSFSDYEVEYKDEKSYLWTIAYPLVDGSDFIEVATTRPETMLGDVAIAVNPDDERFKRYIGKTVKLPLTDREIPILADTMVETEFGTGAVKITPAHDINDFEVGERHKLERITVIGFDGKMTDTAPEKYRGMDVLEARQAILDDLKAQNLLTEVIEFEHSVGHCYKCKNPIQPLLKEQWFVSMKPLAQKAAEALEAGKVNIYPATRLASGLAYLKNIKDWNISRQIAWGIPIPAFQNIDDPKDWIFDTAVDQETIEKDGKTYRRDPDVFDTWFSSGQWPYATLNYPDSQDYKDFYPLSVMETGGEIYNVWVLKMLMLGLYVTGEVPFNDIYIHGYVMAEDGSKMSKSVGNTVNPQEIMAEYGSDALRMGIISGRKAGVNQNFSPAKFTAGRNFCNKLWNIARYIEDAVGDTFELHSPQPKTEADHWIMRELDAAANDIATMLEEYRFSEAHEAVYHTIWDKMADWYLEASKTAQNASVMVWALETCLKLAHPYAPFVTEAIWQTLDWPARQAGQSGRTAKTEMLITSRWPERTNYDDAKADEFDRVKQLISEIREVFGVVGSNDIAILTEGSELVVKHQDLILKLTKSGYVQQHSASGLKLSETSENVWLDLDDEQLSNYRTQLERKLADTEKVIHTIEHRLANKGYVDNAPEALVAESREDLERATELADHLRHQLKHV